MSKRIRLPQTSRMQSTRLFQLSTDSGAPSNVYAWGSWIRPPLLPLSSDAVYVVKDTDVGRLDNISQQFYGTPDLFWVILEVNDIRDQFTDDPADGMPVGTVLRIPRKERVFSILSNGTASTSFSTTE